MTTSNTTPPGVPLNERERIAIIMEEYKTLRSEMIQRHTAFMQVFALATSALVAP